MLTPQDLSQIGNLVHQEIQPINDRLDKIGTQFAKIDDKFKKIDTQFAKIDIQFKGVNKQLSKIQKDLTITINYFYNNHITHKKQLDRIEKHLGLPQFSIN